MNIVVIYGVEHKGSTYNIAQLFLKKLSEKTNTLTEYFLPKDMPNFCCGCNLCFMKGEERCPHYKLINPIKTSMEKADLIIFASPTYVLHTTGQMKTLLDHFGFQYMVHRPNKTMFSKTALVISTAAGGGMKSANKDIIDSLNFWGMGKIFAYSKAVYSISWKGVSNKNKAKIKKDVKILSSKIKTKIQKSKPSLKVKCLFYLMKFMHRTIAFNQIDKEYWKKQGWLGKERPW